MSVIYESNKSALKLKADATFAQRATGRIAKEIEKRVEEYSWASGLIDTETFLTVIPQVWVFDKTEEGVNVQENKAMQLWGDAGFEMQTETLLKQTLLVTALPFGYYNVKNNTQILDRHFYQPVSTIARFLPLQSDLKMPSRPAYIGIGRKGEAIPIDMNNTLAKDQNMIMFAGTGSGKSSFLQDISNAHYGGGDLIRAVDIGYSLKRSCDINKGRFIDIGVENIVMNPFTYARNSDDQDIIFNRSATELVLSEMIYSSSGKNLSEVEATLLKDAVEWVDITGHHDTGIDAVCDYLKTYPKYAKDKELGQNRTIKENAVMMAFNLKKFGRDSLYGKYFNGRSTFNIDSDEYVVLELDKLKEIGDLFRVIVMQVMDTVTQDLYQSNRFQRRFILFEEAAYYFKQRDNNEALVRLGRMIEEGYRRARKYKGTYGTVLQSVLDLEAMGSIGRVLRDNASYKMFLESTSYSEAIDKGIINYDDFTKKLLMSLKFVKSHYSEVFIDTPYGKGILRAVLDPWNYWMNTTNPDDVYQYDQLREKGLTPVEAIDRLASTER